MIDIQTQTDLFKLISKNIKEDVTAFAFGGTAMMFYGYKNTTKDIDIIFKNEKDQMAFINAITKLGYEKRSLKGVYTDEKQKQKGKPVMYTRGDERFDIFLIKIFGTKLTEEMEKKIFARHDFMNKDAALIMNVLSKEDIILLKAVTERERDFDDILTIIEKEKNIDWEYIIDNAIEQKKQGNSWAIIDLEKTMQKLREHTLLKKEYFDRLYNAID